MREMLASSIISLRWVVCMALYIIIRMHIVNGSWKRLHYGKLKQPHCTKWHCHLKQNWYDIVAKVNVTAKVCIRLIYIYVWCKLSSKNIFIITSAGTCRWIKILWVNAYMWLTTLISYMLKCGEVSVAVLCT